MTTACSPPPTSAAWHRGSRAASTSWAQHRGATQGMQERRRRRLPRTAQSSQRPRQLQLRVGDGVHGSAWPPRVAAWWLGGTVHSDLQPPPRLRILPLFFSFLLLLSVSWWWRRIWMGIREATGDWALIGGRLGFGAPKGRRGSSASVPAATRHTSGCARTVGAAAMGAGAVLAPRRTSRRSRDRR
jgi:hypothetical protein